MHEKPTATSDSQAAQENADLEMAVLARVYGLILKWSRQADAENDQSIEENGSKSRTDRGEPEAGEVESSTLKTE
jgi:hypothetical protein